MKEVGGSSYCFEHVLVPQAWAFLLRSLSCEKVAEPSAYQMPIMDSFQANCYELPGILYKASGVSLASDCFQCDGGGGGNLFPRKGW